MVVAQDEDGYLYVLDTYLRKNPPDKQVRKAFELYEKWGFDTLYYKDNGSQALMKLVYQNAIERLIEEPGFKLKGVHQSEDKFKLISTLEPEITNRYLLFADNLDQHFIDQMSYFPSGSHDDGPDALHGAVRQLKRRFGTVNQLVYPKMLM